MKVSEWKKIVDAIKQFASSKPNASGPESLVGVQSSGGSTKLIAGNESAGLTILIDGVASPEGKYGFTVAARPLIESASALPSQDELTLSVEDGSLVLTASGGGRLALKAVGALSKAGFPKKPKQPVATAFIYAEHWGQLSRIFSEVLDKYRFMNGINLRFMEDGCYVVGTAMPSTRYAAFKAPEVEGDVIRDFYPNNHFWSALKILDSNGSIVACEDGFIAQDGKREVFSIDVKYDEKWSIPVLEPMGSGCGFTMKRTELISAIRGQAASEDYKRVTFNVKDDGLEILPFGGESGLRLRIGVEGEGVRSVGSDYVNGILRAMTDAKEVTLRWGNPAPGITISAREYGAWTILTAPVALR